MLRIAPSPNMIHCIVSIGVYPVGHAICFWLHHANGDDWAQHSKFSIEKGWKIKPNIHCIGRPHTKQFHENLPLYLSSEVSVISKAVEADGDRLCDCAHAFLESLALGGESHSLTRAGEGVNVVALLKLGRKVSHQPFIKQPPTNGGIEIFWQNLSKW